MKIKALTVWQPHAQLIALGEKRFETRDWLISYRGWLAIHAAKTFPDEQKALCLHEPFRSVLQQAGFYWPPDLPRGCIVAIVRLVDVKPADEVAPEITGTAERVFGDYSSGRYAWELDGGEEFAAWSDPIRARGKPGLWEWEPPQFIADALRRADSTRN